MAAHNKQFAIDAEQQGSAFVADAMGAWREILCVQEDRTVGNDNTVKWQRLSLQLPPSRLRAHFVKATVRVHEYPDGAWRLLGTPPAGRLWHGRRFGSAGIWPLLRAPRRVRGLLNTAHLAADPIAFRYVTLCRA